MESQVKIKTYIILVDHIQWSKNCYNELGTAVIWKLMVHGWLYAIKTHWRLFTETPLLKILKCVCVLSLSLAPCCESRSF